MAIRLDKAFGGGATTWYQMQAAYDLAKAVDKSDRTNVDRIEREVFSTVTALRQAQLSSRRPGRSCRRG